MARPHSNSNRVDRLYSRKLDSVREFTFDGRTADVFDDMAVRSVPFYHEVQRMMVELAARFVQKQSNIYDLGCATGTTLSLMLKKITDRTVRFYGVDNSLQMIRKAKQKMARLRDKRLAFILQDLHTPLQLDNASVVVMALTLQFVKPLHRRTLIQLIHASLRPGGCLILFEKVLGSTLLMNGLMTEFYHDLKRRHRYSELEIAQKEQALEGILNPYRFDQSIGLLHDCGFSTPEIFFKWYNFAGFLCIKTQAQKRRSSAIEQ